jgi:hypothetical protein
MSERESEGDAIAGAEDMARLRVPFNGVCWWCQTRPATTGEHKFKRTDLTRSMAEDDMLFWFNDSGNVREVRGRSGVTRDRYGVVKFPKVMCEPCNNRRSKPFDTAYEVYSAHIQAHPELRSRDGVDFVRIFGANWREPVLNVARYYAKHFGCRMAVDGVAVPSGLRSFLDGDDDMPDGHMALVTTTYVLRRHASLSISPVFVEADKNLTQFSRYVAVAYVESIGVRYEWRLEGIPNRSQFFHHAHPVINHFDDDEAVAQGQVSRASAHAQIAESLARLRRGS